MPPAAQPVNAVTNALGMMYRRVLVEQVVPDRGVAIVRDQQGFTTEIPYRVQAGQGRMPREGDYWYVDRAMGPWVFSAYIAVNDADISTVGSSMKVEGDLSTVGGLTVGSDLHLAGAIQADSMVTTAGTFHASGNKFTQRTTDTPNVGPGNSSVVASVTVNCVMGESYEATACWHGMYVTSGGTYPANLFNINITANPGASIASNRLLPSNHGSAQLGGSITGVFTAAATGTVIFSFNFNHESGSFAGSTGRLNATASAPATLLVRGF